MSRFAARTALLRISRSDILYDKAIPRRELTSVPDKSPDSAPAPDMDESRMDATRRLYKGRVWRRDPLAAIPALVALGRTMHEAAAAHCLCLRGRSLTAGPIRNERDGQEADKNGFTNTHPILRLDAQTHVSQRVLR